MEFDENAAGEVLKEEEPLPSAIKKIVFLFSVWDHQTEKIPMYNMFWDEHPHDEKMGKKLLRTQRNSKKGDEQEYENCQIPEIYSGISSTRFSGMVQKGPQNHTEKYRNIPSPKSKEVSHQEAKQTPKTGEIPTADQWEVTTHTQWYKNLSKNVTGKGKDKNNRRDVSSLLHFKLNDHLFSAPNEEKRRNFYRNGYCANKQSIK